MPLGRPVDITWPAPDGWTCGQIESDSTFSILSQDGPTVTLVPLALDTLHLPDMQAWLDGDTLAVQPPPVTVDRTMPDTVYVVRPFPAPAPLDIPPGLPEDYLSAMRFWLAWGAPPKPPILLYASMGAALAAAAAWLLIRRRSRGVIHPVSGSEARDHSAEALALLESPHLARGEWALLFGEMDAILRRCAGTRFGIDTGALTWRQISSRAGAQAAGFLEDSAGLVKEIILQRYATWGSTRERAETEIRRLAAIVARWSA